jgi:hypothetical protein
MARLLFALLTCRSFNNFLLIIPVLITKIVVMLVCFKFVTQFILSNSFYYGILQISLPKKTLQM